MPNDTTKQRPKWWRVLAALESRKSLHRFTAEQDPLIRDHCLPSTIAELGRHGLRIEREIIAMPGFGGGTARIARYWLPPDQHQLAKYLLARP